jgi:uncharacterized protein involved in oxidation of intracellular sulfur
MSTSEPRDAVSDGRNVLVICHGPAYGDEHSYSGLRLAGALSKRDGVEVKVFLIGDAVGCAVAGQRLPDGYYHLDRMITAVAHRGGEIGCCGTCMDARAIAEDDLVADARPSTLEELANWVLWADKTITF